MNTTINHELNKKPGSRKMRDFECYCYAGFVFMAMAMTTVFWDCSTSVCCAVAVNIAQHRCVLCCGCEHCTAPVCTMLWL